MIKVYEPLIGNKEKNYVLDALNKGELSGSFGKYIEDFENEFARYSGCKYGVAVSSGTTALHLAMSVIDIKPGDEVLLSSSTNIATALSIVHNGGIPVPVDCEEETWNLNVSLLESLITKKTKAIIPVHLFGHPVNMRALMKIARKYNLKVIEDCAESHGASYRGKITGSFGDMGCYSFYANKIITTGEGGMVITNSNSLYKKLKLLRNLAFENPRFKHRQLGYNFRMTGYQAAMGLAQTRNLNDIIQKKRKVAHTYNKYLRDIEGLQLPVERKNYKNVYWVYAINILPSFGIDRDELIKKLKNEGIETRTFFCSMTDQPCLKKIKKFKKIKTPIASRIWKTGIYLPSSPSLNNKTIEFIAKKIKKIKKTI
jgi:perosamine synthetase